MQQGNVKLVGGASISALDLLHSSNNSNNSQSQGGTPRVVVVANRQRTRAVDEEEHWDQLIRVDGSNADPSDPAYTSQSRRSALSTAVVARWTKRHSSLQRLGTKLSKWARSLKKYSCAADMERDHDKVYLDRHVHPPGHDDKAKQQLSKPPQQQVKGLSSWIDKEASASAALLANPSTPAEVIETKPTEEKIRSMSIASDYDARMIS